MFPAASTRRNHHVAGDLTQDSGAVSYLEEFFKRWVYRWVGNEGQGVEREELRGLAQRCPSGLQVGFEIRNPFIQLLFVLPGRGKAGPRSPTWRPVHPSTPGPLSEAPSISATSLEELESPPGPARVPSPGILTSPHFTPAGKCQEYQRTDTCSTCCLLLDHQSHILKILHKHHF